MCRALHRELHPDGICGTGLLLASCVRHHTVRTPLVTAVDDIDLGQDTSQGRWLPDHKEPRVCLQYCSDTLVLAIAPMSPRWSLFQIGGESDKVNHDTHHYRFGDIPCRYIKLFD